MRSISITFFVFLSILSLKGNPSITRETDFQINFNIAKTHLSQREVNKALPYLLYLQKQKPDNSNLKYLIGVCYVESGVANPETIRLLEQASSKASMEYDPNSIEETRVPIYVFYYLSIAYSQNRYCDQAEEARIDFLEIYPYEDKYYIEESKRWLAECKKMQEQPQKIPLPLFPEFKPYSSLTVVKKEELESNSIQSKKLRSRSPLERKIKTRHIEYSTNYPVYGVQLGAYKEVIRVSRFRELKNIDAFVDKEGLIRYVIGHFSIQSQAETLLELVRSKGYKDAFIVDINNEKKFSDEIVSVDDLNIKVDMSSQIEYKVQIGVFKEKMTYKTAKIYLELDNIKEHKENDLTYLSVGKFKTYTEAKTFEQEVRSIGIKDAFVVAFVNGKKISLEQVNEY